MRQKLSIGLIGIAAAALMPLAAMAAGSHTDVSGVVSNNGSPVKNATVMLHCNGTTKTVHTDKTGTYVASFNFKKCPTGSTITADASKGGVGAGSTSGIATPQTARLNILLLNVAIPEYGTIAGILAVIGAGGALLVTRRRHLGAQN